MYYVYDAQVKQQDEIAFFTEKSTRNQKQNKTF